MKNEKLITLMEMKGLSKTQLSKLTAIPMSTLNRIINGDVQKVKLTHMESIAHALGASVYSIFDLPNVDLPLTTALRPDEAGTVVLNKALQPDESLLLYWYQNSLQESRISILNKAKSEYYSSQRQVNEKLIPKTVASKDREEHYSQLTFRL